MYISKNSAGDFRYALNCLEVLSIASNTQNINSEYAKKILKTQIFNLIRMKIVIMIVLVHYKNQFEEVMFKLHFIMLQD